MKNMLKLPRHTSLNWIASIILLAAMSAHAQEAARTDNANIHAYTIAPLQERYPSDSIQSQAAASAALKDVQDAREQIEARFAVEQHDCYPKFFTTSCLDKTTEHRRKDLVAIRPIEVEANAFIRKAKVVDRDRKLADKAAQDEADAGQRAKEGATKAIVIRDKQAKDQNDAVSRESQRQKRAEESARKVADHAAKEQQRKDREAKDEQQHAVNVAKYNKKQQEAAIRQKDVEQKKADRERQRAEKAAKAAKEESKVPTP
jgi:colicin import membrane protein